MVDDDIMPRLFKQRDVTATSISRVTLGVNTQRQNLSVSYFTCHSLVRCEHSIRLLGSLTAENKKRNLLVAEQQQLSAKLIQQLILTVRKLQSQMLYHLSKINFDISFLQVTDFFNYKNKVGHF